MSEKEHPARTAGRYVRAAGIAFQKERERRQAESERRAQAEQQAAQQAATAAAAQPRPAAPRPAAPPQASTARTRAATPAPAATFPPKPFLDRVLWSGFVLSLVAVCLAALNIQMATSGSVRVGIRLGLGVVLILMALPLLTNWQHTKERLVANFVKRFWGLDAPSTRSGRAVRRVGKEVLTLVGIVWLAIAIFEMLRALVDP